MSKEKVRVTENGEVLNVLTEDGKEIPDPRPMAPPVGFVRREPLNERIRAMVRHEYERVRAETDVESPEEADDFRIPGEEGEDPREGRFALLPGFEWEESYEPPADFKEMSDRLVAAGWTPPAKPARTPPEGGAPAGEGAAPAEAPVVSAPTSGASVPRPGKQS